MMDPKSVQHTVIDYLEELRTFWPVGNVGLKGCVILRGEKRNLANGEIAVKKLIHVKPNPVPCEV